MCGIHHQRDGQPERTCQDGKVDDVLSAIDDGPLRQDFLQLSRGHQAAGKGEGTDDDFQRDLAHLKPRDRRGAHVEFGNADQGRARARQRHGSSAVRCGTAVMCTMPSGMPMPAPMISAMRIHLYCTTSGLNSVATTASAAPISPARTPRRAVVGELKHLERQNEQNDRGNVGEIEILLQRQRGHDCFDLPDLEHAQHAVGDQESAHHIAERGRHRNRAQHGREPASHAAPR